MIGKMLSDRYEIIEEVGSGGMAVVYKAKCHKLNRYVAVKILKEQYREDKEFVARFIRESQAAASLSSPNIVSVYDVGHDGDIDYIIMELVEGITLKEYIDKNGMMDWRLVLKFSLQICSALIDAHRNGIIHRDIKPHNVIVTPNGDCKVADFGIAATTSNISETKKVEDEGGIMGSIHYISPEHAKGVIPDERSDIYSLGITMYEMLTGQLPFDGESSVIIAVKHINEQPTPIKDINIAVPLKVVNIVNKAINKNIEERYQSAKEMYDAIEQVLLDPDMAPLETEEPEEPDVETEIIAGKTKEISGKNIRIIREQAGVTEDGKTEDAPREKGKKKKKGFLGELFAVNGKEDKKAVVWAVITSLVLIFAVTFVCLSIFMPSFGIGALFTRAGKEIEMPSLVGKQFEDVEKEYKGDMNFVVEEVFDNEHEDGEVISHKPGAGMSVKTPVKVQIKVSKGSKELKTPALVGMDSTNAIKLLTSKGLKYKETAVFDDSAESGTVIKQSPAEGEKIKSGDTVTLTVSKGKDEEMITMPQLTGMTESEAKTAITSAKLKVGAIIKKDSDKPQGTVIEQSIPHGSSISKNTSVNITVSSGKKSEDSEQDNNNHTNNNNETPPKKDNDNQGGDNTGKPTQTQTQTQTTQAKQYNLSVSLPADKETVSVIIKQSGSTVYDKTVNTSVGTLNVTLYGTDTANIQVFFDGVLVRTQKVTF